MAMDYIITNIIEPQLPVLEGSLDTNIITEMLQHLPTSLIEQIVKHFDDLQQINDTLFKALVTRRLQKLVLNQEQPKLTYLGISAASVNATQLQNITLKGFAKDTCMVALLPNCKNLKVLNVSRSPGITDTTLHLVSKYCKQLHTLNVRECKVTDAGLLAIVNENIILTRINVSSTLCTDASVIRAIQAAGSHIKAIKLDSLHNVTIKSMEMLARTTEEHGSLQTISIANTQSIITNAYCNVQEKHAIICKIIKNNSQSIKKINVQGMSFLEDNFIDYIINYTPHLTHLNMVGVMCTAKKKEELEEAKPVLIADVTGARVFLNPHATTVHDNSMVNVCWKTTPQYAQQGAWIGIYKPDVESINFGNYFYTSDLVEGSMAFSINVAGEYGPYELRYFQSGVSYECLGKAVFDVVAPGSVIPPPKKARRVVSTVIEEDDMEDDDLTLLTRAISQTHIEIHDAPYNSSVTLVKLNKDSQIVLQTIVSDGSPVIFDKPRVAGQYIIRAHCFDRNRVIAESKIITIPREIILSSGLVKPGDVVKVMLQKFDDAELKQDAKTYSLCLYDNDVDTMTNVRQDRLEYIIENDYATTQFKIPSSTLNGAYSIMLMQDQTLLCKSSKLVVCAPSIRDIIAVEISQQISSFKDSQASSANPWADLKGVKNTAPGIRLRLKGGKTGVRIKCPNTMDLIIKYARRHLQAPEDNTSIFDDQDDEIVDMRTIREGDTLYVGKK